MKKKTVSMMLAATMALSLFAGCGSSKDTATEDTSKTESTETTDESSENASAETTDESSRTTFTVGFDAEYPPYGYMDDNGEYIMSTHLITSSSDSGTTLKEAISDTNVPAPPEEDESDTTENNDMESEGITNEEAGLD